MFKFIKLFCEFLLFFLNRRHLIHKALGCDTASTATLGIHARNKSHSIDNMFTKSYYKLLSIKLKDFKNLVLRNKWNAHRIKRIKRWTFCCESNEIILLNSLKPFAHI